MSGFISTVHLLGRYTELARSPEFQSWLRKNGGEFWHETHASEDGHVTVVVQSLDRSRLYAALVKGRPGAAFNDFTTEIVRTAEIDLASDGLLRPHAIRTLTSKVPGAEARILIVNPVVDFDGDPLRASWEIEVLDGVRLDKFLVVARDDLRQLDTLEVDFLDKFPVFSPPTYINVPTNDWLAENELHHPSALRQEALDLVGDAITVFEKAKRIFFHVRDNYSYNGNIQYINEFTWADLLVRNLLNRQGVCDELSVVAISYLRAVGIPATLKLLHFMYGGREAAHACLEFFDGARWIHMDVHKRVIDLPSIYGFLGWKDITVMDAYAPLDSRSMTPVWGAIDVAGDGKLSTYDDYILSPAYPGERRAGYS
jgi:hypothetical protein